MGGVDAGMFDELTDRDLKPVASFGSPGSTATAAKGNTAKLLQQHAATAGGSSGRRFRRGPIASRGKRFAAAFLDGIFISSMALPILLACMFTLVPLIVENTASAEALAAVADPESMPPEQLEAALASYFMASVVATLVAYAISYVFPVTLYAITVTRSGQTLGKKCIGIRILDSSSGELPGFVRGVLIRSWATMILYLIPGIGLLFSLIDLGMIFREGNQCLHDDMAGTIVVES